METERKQWTAFESDHHRRRTILAHYAPGCGWGWHFLRLLEVPTYVGTSSKIIQSYRSEFHW